MILPTGGGKSLVFQLPTLLKNGISIVISPLIALMQDQVASLKAQNLNADMISSAQSQEEVGNIIKKARSGELKFLYLSPERLNTPYTLDLLKSLNINFFVIDEAHCISQWGHEFRDDYRALGNLKTHFPHTSICAFTATSTNNVTDDIMKNLNLENPVLIKGKIFRKNIFISAQRRLQNGYAQLEDFLSRHENESGIIYVSSRKKVEALSEYLNDNDYKALPYHAGLSQQVREQNFKDFVNDKVNIMVANIAFGMGIDKSDIRFVVHMSLPKTQENYYQEIGRAGRDGLPSDTLLLFSKADEIKRKAFIANDINIQYKDLLEEKLEYMYKFCISSNCRHKLVASYFNDNIKECEISCDNCTKGEVKQIDISTNAQKFLSALYRTNQSFGQIHIIDILRGSKVAKIAQFSHQNLSVYSIGKDKSKNEWSAIVDRLLDVEAITIGEYKALKISNIGFEILKGKQTLFIDEDKIGNLPKDKPVKTKKVIENVNMEYFDKFKELRTSIANEQNVPAYIVFSDKVLIELSATLPKNKEDMLEVNGIGEVKYERYGEEFLNLSLYISKQ